MSAILYYFHDPMCSWCYAFQPVWHDIRTGLAAGIDQLNVVGGLAPDEDEPMSESMQLTIQHHWQRIQQVVPGTEFNFEFWSRCQPRRSTYPACRAVIAAGVQDRTLEERMIHTIQRAYYLEARNPSDYSILIELARELNLDMERFEHDIVSEQTERELQRQIQLTRSFNVGGFPALVMTRDGRNQNIPIDYGSAALALETINAE